MKTNYKQYGLYLIRWQLSTPILAVVLVVLATTNKLVATIVANLIGGLIFFGWTSLFLLPHYSRPNGRSKTTSNVVTVAK